MAVANCFHLRQLARDGETETLEFLLKSLTKVQTRRMLNATTDEEGATPLHLAAKSNHYDVCKKLIEAGASNTIIFHFCVTIFFTDCKGIPRGE